MAEDPVENYRRWVRIIMGPPKETAKPFVSGCCEGERCYCGAPAEHKVGEVIQYDDPMPHRHELTRYICHPHFRELMGPAADRFAGRASLLPSKKRGRLGLALTPFQFSLDRLTD